MERSSSNRTTGGSLVEVWTTWYKRYFRRLWSNAHIQGIFCIVDECSWSILYIFTMNSQYQKKKNFYSISRCNSNSYFHVKMTQQSIYLGPGDYGVRFRVVGAIRIKITGYLDIKLWLQHNGESALLWHEPKLTLTFHAIYYPFYFFLANNIILMP